MFRPLIKKVLCPACGDVVAEAAYRRWPGNLLSTSSEGHRINPVGGAVLRRVAEREIATAADALTRDAAVAEIEFIDRHSSELIYDLKCRRGHATLRTTPQILRAMTREPGEWITVAAA
jgi:hypothetical protein